ncbi:MAG TPA: hypothetical protein VLW26_09995 [Steroidobacteraceae bacterium]|nr:hypothetical protein [Steroidobacteraceae bacterium]
MQASAIIRPALVTLLSIAALTAGGLASAQRAGNVEEQVFQSLSDRLKLTQDQEAQVRPYFDARNSRLKDIRNRLSPNSSRRSKSAALKQARAVQDDFDAQIKPILSDRQRKELEKFRQQVRARLQQEYEARTLTPLN